MSELVSKVELLESLQKKMKESIESKTTNSTASRAEVKRLHELYGVTQFPFVRNSAVAGATHPQQMVPLQFLKGIFAIVVGKAEGATVRQLQWIFDVRQQLQKNGQKFVRVRHVLDV